MRSAALVATCLALCIPWGFAPHARAGTAYRFNEIEIPLYQDGRLAAQIQARQAKDIDLASADRLRHATLESVTIFVYDAARTEARTVPQDPEDVGAAPQPRFKITGDTGVYHAQESKAVLDGNVRAVRFDDQGRAQATLTCPNAVWDQQAGLLTSAGAVRLVRDRDVLEGTDLTYYLSPEGRTSQDGLPQGEAVVLERDVRMTIHSMRVVAAPGEADEEPEDEPAERAREPVTVSCAGRALYTLAEGTVFFSDDVQVRRGPVVMHSEHLKVTVDADPATGGSRVTEMHARPHVRIEGRHELPDGQSVPYRAEGEDAVYVAGLLSLVGTPEHPPEAWYGEDRIRHQHIDLRLGPKGALFLRASGDAHAPRGEALLKPRLARPQQDAEGAAAPSPTIQVTFDRDLVYDLAQGSAVFTGAVRTEHPEFVLHSERLRVETPRQRASGEQGPAALGVRRATAVGDVRIESTDGRTAHAAQAVFDATGQTLHLSGPNPVPLVVDPGQNRIRAESITTMRIANPADPERDFNLVHAKGPGEMKLIEAPQAGNPAADPDQRTTRIRFAGGLEYDETRQAAVFTEDVQLNRSGAVLSADRLEVITAPAAQDAQVRDLAGVTMRRMEASGRVHMHAGGRHTSGGRLTYEEASDGAVTLTLFSGPEERARVWHRGGSSLVAQRIVDYEARNRIEADGPGELNLVEETEDGQVGRSARILFQGRLVYTADPSKQAVARFYRGVELRWQDVTIEGDSMFTELGESVDVSRALKREQALGEPGVGRPLLKRTVESALMTGNVRLHSFGRSGYGDKAIMLDEGRKVTLSARKQAEIQDERGVRMLAPNFVLYQGEGLVRADGPGTLYVAAPAARRSHGPYAREQGRSAESLRPGDHPSDYTVHYDGEMRYSRTERRIVFYRNVELVQETIYGRCDELEALLDTDPERGPRTPGIEGLTVASAECVGNVYFRRYEPPQGQETLEQVLQQRASTKRPGATYLVDCERAFYDVPKDQVLFFGSRRGMRILEQRVSPTRDVRRMLYHNIERAILERSAGNIRFPFSERRRPKTESLPTEGPLEFPPREQG